MFFVSVMKRIAPLADREVKNASVKNAFLHKFSPGSGGEIV